MAPNIEPKIYRIASFVGAGCQGNPHVVYLNPPFASVRERESWFVRQNRAHPSWIAVLVYVGDFAEGVRLEFYQSGHGILRCGSGTLAAAHVILSELQLPLAQVGTAAGNVAIKKEAEWLGYGAQALPGEPCDKDLWQGLFLEPIKRCALMGSETDYCIVELASEQAVGNLRVNSSQLADASARALIATAPATTPGYDYVLRYFAPHHGRPEDPATGSANLQLASYWCERLQQTTLRGRQLSAEGGDFLLQVEAERIWVLGRTQVLSDGLDAS